MVRLEHPRQTGQNVKHQVKIIPVFVYIYFTIYGAGHAYITLNKLSCFCCANPHIFCLCTAFHLYGIQDVKLLFGGFNLVASRYLSSSLIPVLCCLDHNFQDIG